MWRLWSRGGEEGAEQGNSGRHHVRTGHGTGHRSGEGGASGFDSASPALPTFIYLEWWTWHTVVWDVETGELDDDATGPAELSGGAEPAASG